MSCPLFDPENNFVVPETKPEPPPAAKFFAGVFMFLLCFIILAGMVRLAVALVVWFF